MPGRPDAGLLWNDHVGVGSRWAALVGRVLTGRLRLWKTWMPLGAVGAHHLSSPRSGVLPAGSPGVCDGVFSWAAAAGSAPGSSSQQALVWPAPAGKAGGSRSAQIGMAYGHRVRNRQPDGGLTRLGGAPRPSSWDWVTRSGSGA